jgi:His-Xaa-Ser system radical SAM maturase HxsB
MLDFAREHNIRFSCSLDGAASLHNRNRPRPQHDSHERTVQAIRRIRAKLGADSVSALMTTTAQSLEEPEAIIDEYVRQGFPSIFLRWISPFGFAIKSASRIGYDTERFLAFYKRGHIFKLNSSGTGLREEYASIILRKILTPYSTGYVDLQSPAGLGLSMLVYNYDGDVYASDEARMLAEMGDHTFRLGNVRKNSYEQLFLESPLLETVFDTVAEGLPGCSECAFSPYCGTDPVFNHATQRDRIGHRPTSSFCRRNMEILRHLFLILEEHSERSDILKQWAR